MIELTIILGKKEVLKKILKFSVVEIIVYTGNQPKNEVIKILD